jgi:hypothetical protein
VRRTAIADNEAAGSMEASTSCEAEEDEEGNAPASPTIDGPSPNSAKDARAEGEAERAVDDAGKGKEDDDGGVAQTERERVCVRSPRR